MIEFTNGNAPESAGQDSSLNQPAGVPAAHDTVSMRSSSAALRAANAVIPGAGIVWLGEVWTGVVLGLSFCILAALAIAAEFIAPEAYSPVTRAGLFSAAGCSYLLTQLQYRTVARRLELETSRQLRRRQLQHIRQLTAAGQPHEAMRALNDALGRRPEDLLLLVRLAQAQQSAGDFEAAALTWRHIRASDRHHVYTPWADAFDAAVRSPK